jgi:hypothetical protein
VTLALEIWYQELPFLSLLGPFTMLNTVPWAAVDLIVPPGVLRRRRAAPPGVATFAYPYSPAGALAVVVLLLVVALLPLLPAGPR